MKQHQCKGAGLGTVETYGVHFLRAYKGPAENDHPCENNGSLKLAVKTIEDSVTYNSSRVEIPSHTNQTCAPERGEKEIVTLKGNLDIAKLRAEKLQASLGHLAQVFIERRNSRLDTADQSEGDPCENRPSVSLLKGEDTGGRPHDTQEDNSKKVCISNAQPKMIPNLALKTREEQSGGKLKKDTKRSQDDISKSVTGPESDSQSLQQSKDLVGTSSLAKAWGEDFCFINGEPASSGECIWLDICSRDIIKTEYNNGPQLIKILNWLGRRVTPPPEGLINQPPVMEALYQQWRHKKKKMCKL